jgi:hypothetical protein
MKTAVEWLEEIYHSCNTYEKFISNSDWDKAKEMEKQQHLKWNKFLETEKTLGISDVKTIERVQWYYNEYYNETFKSEE